MGSSQRPLQSCAAFETEEIELLSDEPRGRTEVRCEKD